MLPAPLIEKSAELSHLLRAMKLRIATAESCTGGLIASALTELPGSSDIFERGFITYSNQSKIDLLTVPTFYIEEYGAVSMEVAMAMAEGALLMSRADIAISVTGCAGPGGGTEKKPVGTVFIGCAKKGFPSGGKQFAFNGDRDSIRLQSALEAMGMAAKEVSGVRNQVSGK